MHGSIFEKALDEVLACPACHGQLGARVDGVACTSCGTSYALQDGVLDLCAPVAGQEREQAWREQIAKRSEQLGQQLWRVVEQHHAIDLMRQRARGLRTRLGSSAWLLDIGSGCGWHWAGEADGANVIGIDFSLQNCLNTQKFLVPETRTLVVCANAPPMPLRDASISGIWSVQVLQHLPEAVLERAMAEIGRVSRQDVRGIVINLNPGAGLKLGYRVLGKRLPNVDERGPAYLKRRSGRDWIALFSSALPGSTASIAYSELFFHPELSVTPLRYPVRLEHALLSLPWLGALVARQVELEVQRQI